MMNEETAPVETEVVATPAPAEMTQIDGSKLRQMFETATHWLERHVPHVNALNVFPVPDGDTGTNMMLTMQSAIREINVSSGHAGEVAQRLARGALMGARGNSGVILSQILRGFAHALESKEHVTSADFAVAMRRAAEMAYTAVVKPVEGTILTVIREAAETAEHVAQRSNDLLEVLSRTVEAARVAEARTPEFLAVLREAGVTDSGGEGLVVILEGALRALRGEQLGVEPARALAQPRIVAQAASPGMRIDPDTGIAIPEGEWGYDIQYLIRGENLDVEAIRAHITSIGDCPLVVGDETLVKVHVHCPNPGPAIEYGANQGIIFDVVIENMDEQAEAFSGAAQPVPVPVVPPQAAVRTEQMIGVGTVAIAPGAGLRRVFESMGVSRVVDGGQSMNPSTQDLLDAINAIEADTVIVLPNNKNIILAAEQARSLADKTVHVVPSKTVPQGIAAMLALNYTADVSTNVEAMNDALTDVETGEVTQAVRTTTVEGLSVVEGQFIGLHNGRLVVAGDTLADVTERLLAQIVKPRHEIAAFYRGAEVSADEAEALIETLQSRFSDLEFEHSSGDQPYYHFIFSVE